MGNKQGGNLAQWLDNNHHHTSSPTPPEKKKTEKKKGEKKSYTELVILLNYKKTPNATSTSSHLQSF